jgi:hypothetical protein
MLSGTGSPAVRNEPTGSVVVAIRNGTVALRRRASSRCTKQGGKNPQAPCKTLVNRTYEGVSFGFWTGKWSRLGGPIAQCNSAIRGCANISAIVEPSRRRGCTPNLAQHRATTHQGCQHRTKASRADEAP